MELEGHTDGVTAAAITGGGGGGGVLVSCSLDGTARVWDLHTAACLLVLRGHSAAVTAVAVDGAGRYCLTASADTTTRRARLALLVWMFRPNGIGASHLDVLDRQTLKAPPHLQQAHLHISCQGSAGV